MLNSLVKLTHGKTHEILTAKPIFLQIKEHNQIQVLQLVSLWLVKLSDAIGDTLKENPSRLKDLAQDLIEVYKYDSLEDIRECLKNGRRGVYGFGHNKRGFISMMLLREWMEKHLDKKAELREKELQAKKIEATELENFDAKKFYESGLKYQKEIANLEKKRRDRKLSPRQFEEFKNQYFEQREEKEEGEV